ncbi:MAG: mevalonate kinase [Candidatus Bathyarchaeota archaeon]|nr:mevalonate kinase [Candidatus Bathyarchaeota archaeon]
MGTGFGYGKVILFGEHFVVYGLPAIASAIGSKTTAFVRRMDTPGFHLIDDRLEIPGYKVKKKKEQNKSLDNIYAFYGIDPEKQGLEIKFAGDLVAASGIGASAASCAALSRALNDEFNLGFDNKKINAAAYEGEKGYHGTPSGIDNTAATYGGLIWFKRDLQEGPNVIEKLKMKEPVEIVIANTGVTASTSKVVAEVKQRREEQPKKFDQIFEKYKQLVVEAREALIENHLEKLGKLMDENQELLRQIDVSSTELENLINIAMNQGALGAKLTGTGRGGNMVVLTPGKELQERIYDVFSKQGYPAWKTLIGI